MPPAGLHRPSGRRGRRLWRRPARCRWRPASADARCPGRTAVAARGATPLIRPKGTPLGYAFGSNVMPDGIAAVRLD
ncbi:hypothetical protein, partial [Streptomyces stelliscabiei]|uniref:hypothetical protein n=1 Tax=Streptomyces stelliscabiei TaxID=146820 RepID=UPI001ABFADB9